jgi:hypothetical protein
MIIEQKLKKQKSELKAVEADDRYNLLWEKYCEGHEHSTIYHTPEWLNVLEKETGQKILKLICVDEGGNILGLLPLQYTKGFPLGLGGIPGMKRLSSLPRTPVGGPLTSNNEAANLLIQRSIDIVSQGPDYLLQIKTFDSELNDNLESLNRYFWREIYIKEIPDYPVEIRYGKSKNHAKIKWAVQKAEQNNVTHRIAQSEDDLKNWYPLYLDTLRSHATPARSYNFFKHLWEILRPRGLMQLQLAEMEEKEKSVVIAGSVLFFYNKIVTHAFSGSSRVRKHIELRPNDLLHWYAILNAQKEGYNYYDFGEVSSGNYGLAAYKKKWDTNKINMYHYYYPKPAQMQEEDLDPGTVGGIKEKIWKILPLHFTARLGEQVYKKL